MSAITVSLTTDALHQATEQLVLVEGVLLETRDLHERILTALQALANAKAELAAARREVEGRASAPLGGG